MTSIPPEAFLRFRQQRSSAKRRGIPFRFTFVQWWLWWAEGDRWANRGQGKLVMARKGDKGGYEPGNVICILAGQNVRDVDRAVRSKAWRLSFESGRRKLPAHIFIRGDGHATAKAVITPEGRFGSAALAAEHYGYHQSYATFCARKKVRGWRYESEAP